jgi:hypothetical protein
MAHWLMTISRHLAIREFVFDVRVLFVRLKTPFLTGAKSFQIRAIGGWNKRRQPFSGHGLEAHANSLIPREFLSYR